MNLNGLDIILASGSPRRYDLLKSMNIPFRVLLKSVDEDYPSSLNPEQVPEYLAEKKASAYSLEDGKQILITADTVVLLHGEILGKPLDKEDAFRILKKLSGQVHKVITGVCLRKPHYIFRFSDITEVGFTSLSDSEIRYYIEEFNPLDKAGAYGIQEWIGSVGIEYIHGSYNNVMGLPTEKLYKNLRDFLNVGTA
jgi:septum formation protein